MLKFFLILSLLRGCNLLTVWIFYDGYFARAVHFVLVGCLSGCGCVCALILCLFFTRGDWVRGRAMTSCGNFRWCLPLWHFVLIWPVTRPGDGLGSVQKAKSAKNYWNHRALPPLIISLRSQARLFSTKTSISKYRIIDMWFESKIHENVNQWLRSPLEKRHCGLSAQWNWIRLGASSNFYGIDKKIGSAKSLCREKVVCIEELFPCQQNKSLWIKNYSNISATWMKITYIRSRVTLAERKAGRKLKMQVRHGFSITVFYFFKSVL